MYPSRLILLNVISLAWTLSAVSARAETEAEIAYGQAKAAYEAGQFAEARGLLRTASQTDRKNPDIFLLLGKAEYQLGGIEEAKDAWRQTLRLAPEQAYAKRMLEVLSAEAVDVDARLEIGEGLLRDRLLDAAGDVLARLRREKTLSDAQQAGLLLLEARRHLLAQQPGEALGKLRELAVRFPQEAKALPAQLLVAKAQARSPGELAAEGRAALRQLMADHGDTPEAVAAEAELLLHGLAVDPRALPPLVAWLKANPDRPSSAEVRERLVDAIVGLPATAPPAEIGPDSELTETDRLALATAAATYPLLVRPEEAQRLTSQLLAYVEKQYLANKAYAAATLAAKQVLEMQIPPVSKRAAERFLARIAEAREAEAYQKIAYELDQGATDTTALQQWIADHADHSLIPTARKRLVTTFLANSTREEKPGPDAELGANDLAALAAAKAVIEGSETAEDSLAITQQLISHFQTRYAAQKAFAAAKAGLTKVLELPISPAAKKLTEKAIDGVEDQGVAEAYAKILFRYSEGEPVAKDLAAWIAAHTDHAKANEARAKLIEVYFRETTQAALPTADSAMSEADMAALAVAGELFATHKKAADSLALVKKVVAHLQNHYAARQAYVAAIGGVKKLLEFPLPDSSRSSLLTTLAQVQKTSAMTRLTTDAAAGRIKPGPLPGELRAVLDTYTKLDKLFPAAPTWNHRVQLAVEVNNLAATVPWPEKVTEPKPPHQWALEIALPAAGSDDDAASQSAVALVTAIVNDCAAVKQESARGLATRVHARLLAAIDPARDVWPTEVLRRVDLLSADAQAVFDENLRTGRGNANAKLSQAVLQAIASLGELATRRPAQADEVLAKLNQLVEPWTARSHFEAAEHAYAALAPALPETLQREATLIVAELWVQKVKGQHARLLAAGLKVPQTLDPVLQKALGHAYELQRDLPPDSSLLSRVQNLRTNVIAHYRNLEYFDVAKAAIEVKAEEPVNAADEQAELELARLMLATANREIAQQAMRYKGREDLKRTESLDKAIAALKQFVTDRPESLLAPQAVEELFGIGRMFESYERYEVAAEVYSDIARFAAVIDALTHTRPGDLNTAERSALAAATALHTRATKALQERLAEQPADAEPPAELSEEFAAAIAAYKALLDGKAKDELAKSPLVGQAMERIQSVALYFAQLDAWDVADGIYADLLAVDLPQRYPEKLELARALCLIGKVMPDHARQVLQALTQVARPVSAGGEELLAYEDRKDSDELGVPDTPPGGRRPVVAQPEEAGIPAATARPEPPARPAVGPDRQPAAPADISGDFDLERARRESQLLAAVQRQQSSLASRVAQLRDQSYRYSVSQAANEPVNPSDDQQSVARQSESQQGAIWAPVLSDAEIERREKVFDAAYAALDALAKKYPNTPTAAQARGEILVLVAHWRGIAQWQRSADLARRFLRDNPRDQQLPTLRQEVARDLLAWAGQGGEKQKSKQEMLDQVSKRFAQARDELAAIVADFPDDALKHQAQWDIAESYLKQARVVAAFSPTLARGQYVRSADELLRVAALYHDHPRIDAIPQMLWNISNELSSRGHHDEAITVWNELVIHYPMHSLTEQAAMRIAQTYQTQLAQPLRAVEAYIELNFARGGADVGVQNTVYQIAVNLKGEKRWVEALQVLETFTNAFPQHTNAGSALAMIGEIHQTNEAWEDAIAAYERVVDEYENGDWIKQARWSIAECTINLSRWDKAIASYRDFVTSYPEDEKVAEANRRMDVLKTLARYQKVVDEEGQRKAFDAQYQIGAIVRSRLSNPVKAIIEFRKVANDWPAEHLADDALYQVGVLYEQQGDTERARQALLAVADKYPGSPLADDALFMVGKSYEDEATRFSTVTRTQSVAEANDMAQFQAYQLAQEARRYNVERGQKRLTQLKKAGKFAEADSELANYAARNKAFDQAAAQVIADWSKQQAEVLTAQQLADRQDKVNAALRKAVDAYRRAAAMASGDKADDALLRMADIYDKQLKAEDEAMATWLEIVKQFGGTSVAEDSSWKIAQHYERHGEHEKAIDAYQSFLRNYRQSARAGDAMIAVAENYEQLSEWVNAMDWYTNYVNKYPQDPHVERAKEQITWIKTYRL